MFTEIAMRVPMPELLNMQAEMRAKALALMDEIQSNNDWRCGTFSTFNTEYDLLKDELFRPLLMATGQAVLEMAAYYGVQTDELACTQAWLNVAKPGDYQEYHVHPRSHFSAVYYIDVPENSGNLVMRSHEADKDMFPLPAVESTPASSRTFFHVPQAGTALVFRSNLPHMVEQNKSEHPRISVAMNFVFVPNGA